MNTKMNVNVEKAIQHAKDLSQSGNEAEARIILNDLLQIEPDNVSALLILGGSYFCEGLYGEAEAVFYNLVGVAPGFGQASVALFNALWKQDKQENALREIKRFTTVADKVEEKQTIQDYQSIIKQLDDQL